MTGNRNVLALNSGHLKINVKSFKGVLWGKKKKGFNMSRCITGLPTKTTKTNNFDNISTWAGFFHVTALKQAIRIFA